MASWHRSNARGKTKQTRRGGKHAENRPYPCLRRLEVALGTFFYCFFARHKQGAGPLLAYLRNPPAVLEKEKERKTLAFDGGLGPDRVYPA
jgi:hypothetical protein